MDLVAECLRVDGRLACWGPRCRVADCGDNREAGAYSEGLESSLSGREGVAVIGLYFITAAFESFFDCSLA